MIKDLEKYGQRERVIEELSRCDWRGGQSLAKRLQGNTLVEKCGKHVVYVMLDENDETMAVCVLGEKDEIDTKLTPWLGYVYTFPAFRGKRTMGKLITHVCRILKEQHIKDLYVSSNEHGLYEKYGFSYFADMKTTKGETTTVYHRRINE